VRLISSIILIPTIVLAILSITTIILWGKIKTLDEKVAQLEDCIFNHKGCYEKEVTKHG
jgi:hypothetical protein